MISDRLHVEFHLTVPWCPMLTQRERSTAFRQVSDISCGKMDCYPIATSHPSNVPEYHRRSSRIILSSPHRRWYRSQAHRILRYLLLKEAWELRPILNTAVLRLVVANASTTVRPHQDKAYMLPSLYARLLVSHACWRVGAHPDIHSSYIGKAGPDRHGKPVLIIPRGFLL